MGALFAIYFVGFALRFSFDGSVAGQTFSFGRRLKQAALWPVNAVVWLTK